jgi:hypothetical protein
MSHSSAARSIERGDNILMQTPKNHEDPVDNKLFCLKLIGSDYRRMNAFTLSYTHRPYACTFGTADRPADRQTKSTHYPNEGKLSGKELLG